MSKIEYHPNYDKYVEMIVAHPNYQGLYFDRREGGRVNWVVTGKSAKGEERLAWWKAMCKKYNIKIQKGCYAKLARKLHPTGKHVCQCCGKERSIFYEYPTTRTLGQINNLFDLKLAQTDYTIIEFVEKFCDTQNKLDQITSLFELPNTTTAEELVSLIKSQLIDQESRFFSPGAMCNPPDRFNGFHSYALCCRKEKDRGRHDDNMKTYTQDRRGYEHWSDGNYNLANRLMGEFHKQDSIPCPLCGKLAKMSADHIGPISLGFCHSKHFTPLCMNCNSAKNNRFSKEDVDRLIELENKGEQVISWHSKYIWDLVKRSIHNDSDAKKASAIMAKCHQNILNILAIINKKGGRAFLQRYLNPELSLIDYRFDNFDMNNIEGVHIIAKPTNNRNKQKNKERYIRIAFESLDSFLRKENRKAQLFLNEESKEFEPIILAINSNDYDLADKRLNALIKFISEQVYNTVTG